MRRRSSLAAARRGRRARRRAAVVGSFTSRATEIYFLNALLSVAIVVAIYVFVGNSGVLSFGQISFVAVGAFAAGVMTGAGRVEAGRAPRPVPGARATTRSATSPRSCSRPLVGGPSRWSSVCR